MLTVLLPTAGEDLAHGRFSQALRAVEGAIEQGHIREIGLLDLYRSFLLRKVGGLPSIGVESPGDEAAPSADPEIPWLENERAWVCLATPGSANV